MNTVDNISYADSLLNILPDGIVILTFDERVLQVNLQAKRDFTLIFPRILMKKIYMPVNCLN